MEWFIGFLLIVSLGMNAMLYIFLRGGFLRFSHATKTLSKRVDELAETQKNSEIKLKLKYETPESFEGFSQEFSQRIDAIENRIGGLYATFDELDKEFTKLFQERMLPQLVPPAREVTGPVSEVKRSRGGRPPKVRAG